MEDPGELRAATTDAYDRLAGVWAADTESNLWNEHLERPAVRSLLPPDLRGLSILDAGCAGGSHASWMLERGAQVTGVDLSAEMVRAAMTRTGGRGRFVVADLAEPLPLDDNHFDGIVCSLTLHYLRDLDVPLGSFASVLRPGGWLILSSDHPGGPWKGSPRPDYFATELLTDRWTKAGVTVEQSFWRRPLQDTVEALARAG